MFVDDEGDRSVGLDWARRAAQAVVAQAHFRQMVDRIRPADSAEPAGGETPNVTYRSAVYAYGEFGADEATPVTSLEPGSVRSMVVVRDNRGG